MNEKIGPHFKILKKILFFLPVLLLGCSQYWGNVSSIATQAFSASTGSCGWTDTSNKLWYIGANNTNTGNNTPDIFYSSDGVTWTLSASTLPSSMGNSDAIHLNFKNKIFSLGGLNSSQTVTSAVYSSADGSTWTSVGSLPASRVQGAGVVFNCQMWYIGGASSEAGTVVSTIYSSADGASWTNVPQAGLPAINWHAATVYNNKIYVVGGAPSGGCHFGAAASSSNVYSSPDGINWTQISSNVYGDGTPVCGAQLLVVNNKMLLVGGTDNNGVSMTRVYSSLDGITWTSVGNLPQGRSNGSLGLIGGNLAYIGGFYYNTGGDTQTIYKSSDYGATWSSLGNVLPTLLENSYGTVLF